MKNKKLLKKLETKNIKDKKQTYLQNYLDFKIEEKNKILRKELLAAGY